MAFDQIKEIDAVLVRGFSQRTRELDPDWYIQTFNRATSIEWLRLEPASRNHAIFREARQRRAERETSSNFRGPTT